MIGWYLHHQGRGHLTRARAITPHLDEPVTFLSSLARPPGIGPDWVELELDYPAGLADHRGTGGDAMPGDPTAHGTLHWAPLATPGLSRRMATIAAWIAESQPRVMVVDVSVEVTLLARLCGVPVIVMAAPGQRNDPPHQLAYTVADSILAAWSREVYQPAFLQPFDAKTIYTGAISRFDGRPDPRRQATGAGVFVLNGAGGTVLTAADVDAAQTATPDRPWSSAGLPGTDWVEDVWSRLVEAEVVVTHAGQNALADTAAARRPAVIIAQSRPFGEQADAAGALAEAGIAVVAAEWPQPADWPDLLDRARALGGQGWRRWSPGDGAVAAAAAISR